MDKQEYQATKEALKEELRALHEKIIDVDASYARECMERNGYKVGQMIKVNGREGIVVGAMITNGMPQLDVRKIRKDGTPSEVRSIPLCIHLKQE